MSALVTTCSICLDSLDKAPPIAFSVARNQQTLLHLTTHETCFKIWRTCAIAEQGNDFLTRQVFLPPNPSKCWHKYTSIHFDENAMNALPNLELKDKDWIDLVVKILKAPIVSQSNSFGDFERYRERYAIVKQLLIESSRENQPETVEQILNSIRILNNVQMTTEIRLTPEDRSFALWAASQEGHDQIVKLLLDHDDNIPHFKFTKAQKGYALELAIKHHRETIVKRFLDIESIPNHYWDLSCPLIEAASAGKEETVGEILQYDLILRAKFPSAAKLGLSLYTRSEALVNAAGLCHATIVEQLLAHNEQLKEFAFTDEDLGKALEAAAAHNCTSLVRLLLTTCRIPQHYKQSGTLSAATSLNREMFDLLMDKDRRLSLGDQEQAVQRLNELRSTLEPDDLESFMAVEHMLTRISQEQTRLSEPLKTSSAAPAPSSWYNCTLV